MFRHSAGDDLIDQVKFMADQGFRAMEDNGMKDRPVDEQSLIAREMAEEESGHVRQLELWIARMSDAAEVAPEDLDPPNMPE